MEQANCDDIEATIEKELHGAASAEEAARVAEHVAGCERCSAYLRGATRSRVELSALASTARSTARWDELEARLRNAGKERLRRTLILALIGPLAVTLSLWGTVPPGERLLVGLADAVIVAAVIAFRIGSAVRASRRIAGLSGRADLFAASRTEVAHEIRRTSIARWVALALVVVLVAGALLLPSLPLRGRLVYAGLAAIVAAVWAERLLVQLPRLRRELEALERGAE